MTKPRHAEYLSKAGFVQVESGRRVYTVGGPTAEGQRVLINLVPGIKSARRGLVEGLQLISAEEFDEHMQPVANEVTPVLTG